MTSLSYGSARAARLNRDSAFASVEFAVVQAAVFLAPFIAFRFSQVYITASDCLFLLSFAMRIKLGLPLRPLGRVAPLWIVGVALLSAGLYLGSLINGDTQRGLIVTAQYQFAYLLLPLALLGRSPEQTKRLIKCGVWSVVVLCLVGFWFYFAGTSGPIASRFFMVTGNGRMASFTDSANGLAGVTVFALPLLAYLAFGGHKRHLVAIACFMVILTGLILTASNTGLLTAIAGFAVFLLVRRSIRTFVITSILGAAAYYSVVNWGHLFLAETFQLRVVTALTTGDVNEFGTFASRYDLIVEAWEMIDRNLFIGLGADQYRVLSMYDLPVHNMYLLLVNEGGILALVGWLLIQTAAIVAVLSQRGRPGVDLTILATTTLVAVTLAFATASSHMYARYLIVPLLLALSPAVATIMATDEMRRRGQAQSHQALLRRPEAAHRPP